MVIDSMQGLGDNIYQRAFVKQLKGPVVINTPWPQLYSDLPNVIFARRNTTLRTQRKNVETANVKYDIENDIKGPRRKARYSVNGVLPGMAASLGVQPGPMDLPSFGKNPHAGERYALIRPVTVRREWAAHSRNCLPEYVETAVKMLKKRGIKTISVADLEPKEEWLVGEAPLTDIQYHKGELDVEQLLSLTQDAWVVVGPVGWIVPACMAYRTQAVIICGGQGGFNHPSKLTDARDNTITFAMPDTMCMCTEKSHECEKTITKFDSKFASYLDSRTKRRLVPPGTDTIRR